MKINYSLLGIMFVAMIILLDRFVNPLPEWMAIILAVAGIVSFFIGMYRDRKSKIDMKDGSEFCIFNKK